MSFSFFSSSDLSKLWENYLFVICSSSKSTQGAAVVTICSNEVKVEHDSNPF